MLYGHALIIPRNKFYKIEPLIVGYTMYMKTDEPVLFAGSQLQGRRKTQEDTLKNYDNECFVIADGVSGLPHGDVASALAADSAVWGYKLIRQRKFYWSDKQLLLKRIFRSSNISVWQKRKESGFLQGLASTLSVVIVNKHKIWAGTVGDSGILLYRDGLIDILTPSDCDENGNLTDALGFRRFGLVPHIAAEKFLPGDILCMATDGVLSHVSEDELRVIFEMTGSTDQSISTAVTQLLTTAYENGSGDNLTAYMIKMPEH
jgi:serine/threonine protein phosphatase PrpC